MAPVLPQHENEVGDKRVESILFPRLDEGSTPSWSTLTQRDARSRPAAKQGRLHAYIASWGVGCTPFTYPYIYNGESRTLLMAGNVRLCLCVKREGVTPRPTS